MASSRPEGAHFNWPTSPPGGGDWGAPWPPAPANPGDKAPGHSRPYAPVPSPPAAYQGPASEQVEIGPNTRCYEHPDRLAGAICRSCNRPICADCMVQAPVGWHCRRCVRLNARRSPVRRYQPGAGGLARPGYAPVTLVLVAVNVVLFLAAAASPAFTSSTWEVPYLVRQGQWYRLFSSFFVTNDVLDIALNMFSLYIIGRLVEPALDKWRYLALYLLSGLGGSVATYLLANGSEASAGASGAIFGLIGAFFVLARRARLNTSGIVAIIVLNLVFDFTYSGINWLAHLGGLGVGLAVAFGYGLGGRDQRQKAALLTVVATCVVLGLLMLLPPGRVALE